MAEYIDREQTVRTAITAITDIMGFTNSIALVKIAARIREVPSADVVEVVRCLECRHTATYTDGTIICLKNGVLDIVKDNHFCSYGERRSDK